MSSLVSAKPERRSLEGLPNGGLGVRSPRERLEDIRDLCQEQGRDLQEVLESAWDWAHPREPLPVEWELAFSLGQVWVPDELTLYCAEYRLFHKEWPIFKKSGEVLRSGGHVWETCLDSSGTCWYRRDGQRHREDGPAVIWANGGVEYWMKGQVNREDGPAVVGPNGEVHYWVKGKRHRTDGPAVVEANGRIEYWVEGRKLTKGKFLARYGQRQAN